MKLLSRSEMYEEFPAQYVKMIYQDEVDKHKKGEPIDADKVRRLLIHLDNMYSEGKLTPLMDSEYDTLHEIYLETTGELIRGDTDKEKVKHDYPRLRGTLKKVHYVDEAQKKSDPNAVEAHKVLSTWYYNTLAMLDWSKPHYFGMWKKYNGLSIVLSLNEIRRVTKAVTRGETDVNDYGIDKTSLFDNLVLKGYIPDIYDGKKVGMKTECIMSEENFKKYNQRYGNNEFVDARAAVTSLINSKYITDLHTDYIDLIPLLLEVDGKFVSYIEDVDYGPIKYKIHRSQKDKMTIKELEEFVEIGRKVIDEGDYDCDGLVFRWYDQDAMEQLGRDESNAVNRFEIAFKFPRESKYTKLIDIKQEIGLLGKVSFTAEFETVKFKDKKIVHASLGSYERMKELKLAKGDMVKITYEIIPYLLLDDTCMQNKSGNESIPIITHCPYCNTELDFNPEYSCVNDECPSRMQGKLLNFCIRMNIPGIGPSMVEDLFHAGIVSRIEDFFALEDEADNVMNLDGFGKKTTRKLIKAFKKLEATEAQILSSVSIPGIGNKKSMEVLKIYNIKELLKICEDNEAYRLTTIKGISDSTADKIVKGVNKNIELIKFLLDNVKITKINNIGEVVLFTGFRNPKFAKFLNSEGVEVADSFNKSVTLVIARDPEAKTDKLEKARKNNIPIMSEIEAYEEFKFIK